MPHALIIGETVEELSPATPFADATGIQYPAVVLQRWSPAELEAIGVYAFEEVEPPEDQVIVVRGVAIEAGRPVRTVTLGAAPLPPVPAAVDMRQARLKLVDEPHGEGSRLDAVEAYVATQDRKAQIEWVHSKELRRDHPLVGIMGLFFEQTSADIDQWFREAAAIGPTLAL